MWLARRFMFPMTVLAVSGLGFSWASGTMPSVSAFIPFYGHYSSPNCDIKGNISATGERIYHVPGQRYYRDTVISTHRGERWFCNEVEAWRAGWRKALR